MIYNNISVREKGMIKNNVYKSYVELIGNTPLMELVNLKKYLNLKSKIYVKLENMNPGGSIKDRAALFMINKALEEGKINGDTTIIEATSGNTGIAVATICASLNIKCIIIMPENMSLERIKILKQLGAEVMLTDKSLGMKGSIEKLEELKKEIKNHYTLNQFDNSNNYLAHYETTAKEIYDSLDGNVDYFVSAVGTSGTIMGCAKYFKEKNNQIMVVAVEPSDSAVLSNEKANVHKIQGIGAGFVPSIFDYNYIDKIEKVNYQESIESAKLLAQKEGILTGISSGANLSVAIKYARQLENKSIVIVLPDCGSRYFSTELFD